MDYFPTYHTTLDTDRATREMIEALHAEPEPVELQAIIDVCTTFSVTATLATAGGWQCGSVAATGAYRLH